MSPVINGAGVGVEVTDTPLTSCNEVGIGVSEGTGIFVGVGANVTTALIVGLGV